ncbi:MAG TPA: histidine triad nucleotide-binding protein [Burkholderiaceae bacterium]|nr:histidine triad nucleotide-binding protein [Burkholderiaceae bacterium]
MNCIFCKIVAGEIPAQKVFEDEDLLAFRDIHPKAPLHLLVIPKKHIESMARLAEADTHVMGRMMVLAGRLAAENGSPDGFRTVVNTGRVGRQEVYHLHMHLLGGPEPLGSSAAF